MEGAEAMKTRIIPTPYLEGEIYIFRCVSESSREPFLRCVIPERDMTLFECEEEISRGMKVARVQIIERQADEDDEDSLSIEERQFYPYNQ